MEKNIYIQTHFNFFVFYFIYIVFYFYTVCTVIYLFMNTVENTMVWFDEIFYIPNEYRLINRRSFIVTFLHSE
jgi:hypothetical protein